MKHLYPDSNQRQSSQAFEVRGCGDDPEPSLSAKGINGQITGGRADTIIADDVEVQTNSLTPVMRDKISEAVKEFDSVLKPLPTSRIKYLGTDHDQDSLYTKLEGRGYSVRIWPVQYPSEEMLKKYGDKIAPYILDGLRKDASLVGHSTEPTRFSDDDLEQRKLSLGSSEFSLQFLLDTSLSDANKYPLRLDKLMVVPLDNKEGPDKVVWGVGDIKRHLPTMGRNGDYYHGPAHVSDATSPYTRIVATTDISGRGSDETAMVIGAELNGVLFILHVFASLDGYSAETLMAMAGLCVRYNVHQFHYEANFGDGMFGQLFGVALRSAWKKANEVRPMNEHSGTELVELKTGNQTTKEKRIIGAVEPVLEAHRLVVSEAAIQMDYDSLGQREGEESRHKYSMFWQMTHLTRDHGCIPKDDRVDALGMFVGLFAGAMGLDPAVQAETKEQDRFEEELQAMLDEADDIHLGSAPLIIAGAPRRRSPDRVRAAGPTQR